MTDEFSIRPYESGDLDAVYEVCLKTGDSGDDATHLFDDPMVLGHLYTGPYITRESGLAFVLEDAEGVCGYVLGALDTDSFYRWMLDDWLPKIRDAYQAPEGNPEQWSRTQQVIHLFFEPMEVTLFEGYPSHLHIDILPRAQGKGLGRNMMDRLLDQMKLAGSPGVHLGMAVDNDRAHRFYLAYGFKVLNREGGTIYMGLKF